MSKVGSTHPSTTTKNKKTFNWTLYIEDSNFSRYDHIKSYALHMPMWEVQCCTASYKGEETIFIFGFRGNANIYIYNEKTYSLYFHTNRILLIACRSHFLKNRIHIQTYRPYTNTCQHMICVHVYHIYIYIYMFMLFDICHCIL